MSLYSVVCQRNWDENHVPNANTNGYAFALLKLADALADDPSGTNAVDAVCDRIDTLLGGQFRLVSDHMRQTLSTLRENMARNG
jgi:hypothetical protein